MAAIVVVGAGVGGLATALALARHGIAAEVVERADAPQASEQLITLSPNAWRALAQLGLDGALASQASTPSTLSLHDGVSGKLMQRLPLTMTVARYGEAIRVLPYQQLHSALLHACMAQPLVSLKWSSRVQGIGRPNEADPEAAQVLAVNCGSFFVDAKAIVGADGADSAVRELTFGAAAASPEGMQVWSRVLSAEQLQPCGLGDDPGLMQWWAPGVSIHLLTHRLTGTADLRVYARAGFTLARALQATPLRALAQAESAWHARTICAQVPVKEWCKGRITLLGDAAHYSLPFMGQGEALALEDAIALADCVSWAPTLAQAFSAYERLRRPRDRRVQQACISKSKLEMSGGLVRWVRNLVVRRRAPTTPLEVLAWIYEH
jgi:2-polyprenyl-6-methoxyphenol hydroxylase-like FAD-dependent oxidoreductase